MPSVLNRLKNAARAFATGTYDATDDRGRRRPARTHTSHEDKIADARKREALTGTTRDLARNWELLAWAVRKHLDYVADFTFQPKTADAGFNKEYSAWWQRVTTPDRFDVAGRHSHRRAVRITEACKTLDGDCGWLKIAPPAGNPIRGTIQGIEGDRIAMPRGDLPRNANPEDWVNGVRTAENGRALAYGICKRTGKTQKQLQRIVPARNLLLHANYEFRWDQVRGISPIAAGLNHHQDLYESVDHNFAKVKLGALFGLQITSGGTDGSFGPPPANDSSSEDESDSSSASPLPLEQSRIPLNRGPFVAELQPGEEAKVIESHTPSGETVAFLQVMILLVLRALDIPYSFLDESFTNFYGSRGGLIQYLLACHNKVLDLQDLQNAHHRWRAELAIEDGELVLPSGRDVDWLTWEFVPGGVPWWDATKEVRGAAMSIAAGLSSPQKVCREIGSNFETNILETAEAMKFAEAAGVPLTFADSSAFAPEITVTQEAAA